MSQPPPLRVALYSHDGMGLGHLRRNALIATSLSQPPTAAAILLIAGAPELTRFGLPESVGCLTLPGLKKTGNGQYRPRRLGIEAAHLAEVRRNVLTSALEAYRPDLLIVDKHPAGLCGELLPSLEHLRARGTRVVLGLRDILDEPEQVRSEWAGNGSDEVVEEFYDAVWVYGDPRIYDLIRECGFSSAVSRRTRFTGYLDPRRHHDDPSPAASLRGGSAVGRRPGEAPGPYLLCHTGGGQDGGRLAEAFAEAEFPEGKRGVLVQGPYLPQDSRDRIRKISGARRDLQVLDFVPGTSGLVNAADGVISMAGYNSVCEVLISRRRALVVPRVKPRQEQRIRAERMGGLGLLDWLHPDVLTPSALSQWMEKDSPLQKDSTRRVDFKGLERLRHLTLELTDRKEQGAGFIFDRSSQKGGQS